MSAQSESTGSIELSLSADSQWVLHHVLLDRLERAADASGADAPPIELYGAFERLDGGETAFTAEQLAAVQDVLATYQRASDEWELERSRIERLLREVATALESTRSGS